MTHHLKKKKEEGENNKIMPYFSISAQASNIKLTFSPPYKKKKKKYETFIYNRIKQKSRIFHRIKIKSAHTAKEN